MDIKKGLIAGVGALMLLGGVYQIQSAYAAESATTAETQGTAVHVGKKAEILGKYQEQIHQVNQLREERLDLKKQMIDNKDQLVDLFLAAKNSGNKKDLKQVREIRKQVKASNAELKTLLSEAKTERKNLKEATKTGDASESFDRLIAIEKQINEKMKERLTELDRAIEILK